MRIQTLFVILVALLSLCRIGELCGSVSKYTEATGLLSLGQLPGPVSHDAAAAAALEERKRESLENAIQSGAEVIMLAGVAVCFFVFLRRRALPQQVPA
jgi:hypothetical protein